MQPQWQQHISTMMAAAADYVLCSEPNMLLLRWSATELRSWSSSMTVEQLRESVNKLTATRDQQVCVVYGDCSNSPVVVGGLGWGGGRVASTTSGVCACRGDAAGWSCASQARAAHTPATPTQPLLCCHKRLLTVAAAAACSCQSCQCSVMVLCWSSQSSGGRQRSR
jgi:hypothetical protein